MQILTHDVVPAPQAPPSQTPAAPTTAAPTHTTSAPPSQLPTTGPSEAAQGALVIGLPLVLLGAVAIVLARRWRARTG